MGEGRGESRADGLPLHPHLPRGSSDDRDVSQSSPWGYRARRGIACLQNRNSRKLQEGPGHASSPSLRFSLLLLLGDLFEFMSTSLPYQCRKSENHVGEGGHCVDGGCVDSCLEVACSAGFVCELGECVRDLCFDVVCATNYVCLEGNCVEASCLDVTCEPGSRCVSGECVAQDACWTVTCPSGLVCQEGACIEAPPTDDKPGGDGSASDGCACSTTRSKRTPLTWMAVAGLLLGLIMRRRRSR